MTDDVVLQECLPYPCDLKSIDNQSINLSLPYLKSTQFWSMSSDGNRHLKKPVDHFSAWHTPWEDLQSIYWSIIVWKLPYCEERVPGWDGPPGGGKYASESCQLQGFGLPRTQIRNFWVKPDGEVVALLVMNFLVLGSTPVVDKFFSKATGHSQYCWIRTYCSAVAVVVVVERSLRLEGVQYGEEWRHMGL